MVRDRGEVEMKSTGYSEPVSKLLSYGETDWDEWDDYEAYDFSDEHIPELIRMGTDRHLLIDEDVDNAAMWAPMHAWRMLAQMYAVEAIDPLVQVLAMMDESESDLINEGLQDVLERFGPAAIESLEDFINKSDDKGGGLVGAAKILSDIGRDNPETRDRVVQIISSAFEARYAQNDPMVNGFWISSLIDLQAVESYPMIKKAYEEGMVDPHVCGDLEDVEIELGLREKRTKLRPLTPFQRAIDLRLENGSRKPVPLSMMEPSKDAKKEKAKRKQEKKSRKKNRKKK
jgi:hypothetical protein